MVEVLESLWKEDEIIELARTSGVLNNIAEFFVGKTSAEFNNERLVRGILRLLRDACRVPKGDTPNLYIYIILSYPLIIIYLLHIYLLEFLIREYMMSG